MIIPLDDQFRIRGAKQKFIAFHKGYLLSDSILVWIIDAAQRGLMTPSGAKLLLIPDTRKGPPDTFGRRIIGKFLKSDCFTVKQLIRKLRNISDMPKVAKNGEKT